MSVITIDSWWDGNPDTMFGGGKFDGISTYTCVMDALDGYYTKGAYHTTWFRFDLTPLPSGATVTLVRLRVRVTTAGGSAGLWIIRAYGLSDGQPDPRTDTANNCEMRYKRCCVEGVAGEKYVENITEFRAVGFYWFTLGGGICQDMMDAKAAVNRFSFGLHELDQNDQACAHTSQIIGEVLATLEITYTVPTVPSVGYSYSDGFVCVNVFALMRNAILSVCGRGLMKRWVE